MQRTHTHLLLPTLQAALQFVLSYPTRPATIVTGTLDDCVQMVLNGTAEAAMSDRGLLDWCVGGTPLDPTISPPATATLAPQRGGRMRALLRVDSMCDERRVCPVPASGTARRIS